MKLINFQDNPFNLIKSSDLFILTSIYEGLPNVLLEALVLKKLNRLEDAVESLNQAIKIKPDFIEAYNGLGHLLVELNQLDAALKNFDKAIN